MSYLDPLTPKKYSELYNRLDFIEKKISINKKLEKIRAEQQYAIDLPAALAEAIKRGLITSNQINSQLLKER